MDKKETHLQQMLSNLRTRLLVMCASVGIAVDEACSVLMSGNIGKAKAVFDGDTDIDSMENEIDELALSTLVRNQPVAQDLRFVIAGLRMVIDLERIGDEAVNIAEHVIALRGKMLKDLLATLDPLAQNARKLYHEAVRIFQNSDTQCSLALCSAEEKSLEQEMEAFRQIFEFFANAGNLKERSADAARESLHAILICRALNRIARHSSNIAEHTYFIARGINIKHGMDDTGADQENAKEGA